MKAKQISTKQEFFKAVFSGNDKRVKRLLNDTPKIVNEVAIFESNDEQTSEFHDLAMSPLSWLIIGQFNDDIFELLIKNGAYVDIQTPSGLTLLHIVAMNADRLGNKAYSVFRRFMLLGLDIEATTKKNETIESKSSNEEFKQYILQLKLHKAVEANDLNRVSDLIDNFGAQLQCDDHIQKEVAKSQDTENNLRLRTAYTNQKKQLRVELHYVREQRSRLDKQLFELLELKMLTQDKTLCSLDVPKTFQPLQSITAIMMQIAFQKHAEFDPYSDQNMKMPSHWFAQINSLLSTEQLVEPDLVNKNNLDILIKAFNKQYFPNSPGIRLEIHVDEQCITTNSDDEKAQLVTLYGLSSGFVYSCDSSTFYDSNVHASLLLQKVTMVGGVLEQICSEYILHQTGKALKNATLAQLRKFLTSQETNFSEVTTFSELQQLFLVLKKTNNIVDLFFSVLNRLCEYEKNATFKFEDISRKVKLFGEIYLVTVRRLMNEELCSRREQLEEEVDVDNISLIQRKIREKKAALAESLVKKEQVRDQIKLKESEIDDAKKKTNILEKSYKGQSDEIDKKINQLEDQYSQKREENEKLVEQSKSDQGKVETVDGKRKVVQKDVEQLSAKKDKLVKQKEQLEKKIEEVSKQKISEQSLKNKLLNQKELLDGQKKVIELEKDRLAFLSNLIKTIQQKLISNKDIYDKRETIRDALEKIKNSGKNDFLAVCRLMVDELKIEVTIDNKLTEVSSKAGIFFNELIDAVLEIFKDPDFSFDKQDRHFTYKGFNLGWRDAEKVLKQFVCDRLIIYGLEFDKKHGYLCFNFGITKLKDLPKQLRELIKERIQTQYMPSYYCGQEDDPKWDEYNALSDDFDIIVKELKIHFNDVLPCFIDRVSLVAGNNVYVDDNIKLPGVDFSILANQTLYLKKSCVIETSTPNAVSYKAQQARCGDEYNILNNGQTSGHFGDDGLCGLQGYAAGHIYLCANKDIDNLDTLHCKANGGKGASGQAGGDGGQGKQGGDTPDADPPSPRVKRGLFGSNSTFLIIDEARTPGLGRDKQPVHGEISGPGGDGGRAGRGGQGGFKGDIIIEDEFNTIRLQSGSQAIYNGVKIGKDPAKRMSAVSGNNGSDGPKEDEPGASRGGQSGEAGYKGFPVAKIKKVQKKRLIFFKKWHVTTHRDNYDLQKVKDILDNLGKQFTAYGDVYVQKDWGATYSHRYETGWIFDLPLLHGKEGRRSKHVKSRAKSEKKQYGLVPEERRKLCEKRSNKALEASFRNGLQQKAQKQAKLLTVEEIESRVSNETAQWDQKLTGINAELATNEASISEKTSEIADLQHEIDEKGEQAITIQKNISAVETSIKASLEEINVLAEQFFEAMSVLEQDATAQEQAAEKVTYSKIDWDGEVSVKERLKVRFDALQQLLILKQKKLSGDVNRDHDLLAQLDKQVESIREEIEQLNKVLNTLLQTSTDKKNELDKLNDFMTDMNVHKTTQTIINQQYDATVSIDQPMSEHKTVPAQDEIFVPNTQSTPDVDSQVVINELKVMCGINLNGASLADIISKIIERVSDPDFYKDKSLDYKRLIPLLTGLLIKKNNFQYLQIVSLWKSMLLLTEGLNQDQCSDKTCITHLINLLLQLNECSVQWICSETLENIPANEQKIVKDQKIKQLRIGLNQILYPEDRMQAADICHDINFRLHFYSQFKDQTFFEDEKMLETVDALPKSFDKVADADQAGIKEILKKLCSTLYDNKDDTSNLNLYQLYFKCIDLAHITNVKNLGEVLVTLMETIEATEIYKESYQAGMLARLCQFYARTYLRLRTSELEAFFAPEKDDQKPGVEKPNVPEEINYKDAVDNLLDYIRLQTKLVDSHLITASNVGESVCLLILKANISDHGKLQMLDYLQAHKDQEPRILFTLLLESINVICVDEQIESLENARQYIQHIRKIHVNADVGKNLVVGLVAKWHKTLLAYSNQSNEYFDDIDCVLSLAAEFLSDEDVVLCVRKLSRIFNELDKVGDEQKFVSELRSFKGMLLENLKKNIEDSLTLDLSLEKSNIYEMSIKEMLKQKSYDTLLLQKLICCLSIDEVDLESLRQVETSLSLLKSDYLCASEKANLKEYFGQIQNFDQVLNQKMVCSISKPLTTLVQNSQNLIAEYEQLEKQSETFCDYFQSASKSEFSAILSANQQQFVVYLLHRLKYLNVDFKKAKSVEELINLINQKEQLTLCSMNLFSLTDEGKKQCPAKMTKALDELKAQISQKKLPEIFTGVELLLVSLTEYLNKSIKKEDPVEKWCFDLVADFGQLFEHILFDDIEQQHSLLRVSISFSDAVSSLYVAKKLDIKQTEMLDQFAFFSKAFAYKAGAYEHVNQLTAQIKSQLQPLYSIEKCLQDFSSENLSNMYNQFNDHQFPSKGSPRFDRVKKVVENLPNIKMLLQGEDEWKIAIAACCDEYLNENGIQSYNQLEARKSLVSLLVDDTVSVSQYAPLYGLLKSGKLDLDSLLMIAKKVDSTLKNDSIHADCYFEIIRSQLFSQLFVCFLEVLANESKIKSHIDQLQIFKFSDPNGLLKALINIGDVLSVGKKENHYDFDDVLDNMVEDKDFSEAYLGLLNGLDSAENFSKNSTQLNLLSLLIDFSSKKSQILEQSIEKLKALANQVGSIDEVHYLLKTIKIRYCKDLLHKAVKDEAQIEHISALIFNLNADSLNNSGDVSLGHDLLDAICAYLKTSENTLSIGDMITTIDDKFKKLIIDNVFTDTESCYVSRLPSDAVKQIVCNVEPQYYLEKLKKTYWSSGLCVELFGDDYTKYYKNEKLLQLKGFSNQFKYLVVGDDFHHLEKVKSHICDQVRNVEITGFLESIEDIIKLKKQLLTTHSIAISDGDEATWLVLIDNLLKMRKEGLSFKAMSSILHATHYFENYDQIVAIIEMSDVKSMLQHIWFEVINNAIAEKVDTASGESQVDISKLKDASFNSLLGLQSLELLAKKLLQNSSDHIKIFSSSRFDNLLSQFIECKVYQDSYLIEQLGKQSIERWGFILNRQILANRLGLNVEKNPLLIEDIVHIQNSNRSNIVSNFLEIIESLENIDYFQLEDVCCKFATGEWPFRQDIIDKLTNKPLSEWTKDISGIVANEKAVMNAVRSPKELVSSMRDYDIPFAKNIVSLLKSETEQSKLEDLLSHIRTRYDEQYCAKEGISKKDIKEKIHEKIASIKSNPKSLLKLSSSEGEFDKEIIDFLALMMGSVKLVEDKIIRDTQLVAMIGFIYGFRSSKGRLANISTGEGKSLITRMFAITCALRGEIVDVITSSKVLAIPDAQDAQALCEFFDIKVHNNCDGEAEKNEKERQKRYASSSIIYGDVGSFQRDILMTEFFGRNIRPNNSNRLIVDEVDSALIDNTDKVLYISHSIDDLRNIRQVFEFIWQCVHSKDTYQYSNDNVDLIFKLFEAEVKNNVINRPPHLDKFIKRRFPIWVKNAYMAKKMDNNNQYSVIEQGDYADKAVINDLATGVEQFQSQWNNGLHQFIQLKHRKEVSDESLRAIFISNVSYFNRYKETGCMNGMTGTIGSDDELQLLSTIYGVEFFAVPEFKRKQFYFERGKVCGDENPWTTEIIQDVLSKVKTKKPFTDIERKEASSVVNECLQQESALNHKLSEKISEYHQYLSGYKSLAIEIERLSEQVSNAHVAVNSADKKIVVKEDIDKSKEAMAEKELEMASLQSDMDNIGNYINQLKKDQRDCRIKKERAQSVRDGNGGRAVLVICENKEIAANLTKSIQSALSKELADSNHQGGDNQSKKFNVYQYTSFLDGLDMKSEKVQPGDVIVATNIAGRGTDLEISQYLEENQGLHVILSYMPSNIRIERQAFGRTSRKGQPGTGRFIVCDPRKTENYNIPIEFLRNERDELERSRLKKILQVKIPRLDIEQKLMNGFSKFQDEIKKKLKAKAISEGEVGLQLKSLQNHWAFWLDKHDQLISEVYKNGEQDVFRAFEKFKKKNQSLLKKGREMLITEPSEFMKLAQHLAYIRHYDLAILYFQKVIDVNPDFCGFAHYYLAQTVIRAGTSSGQKNLARVHLKKAAKQFQLQIQRLTTANQVIELVSRDMRNSGQGLSSDMFTKTNVDEIGIYTIHLNACKEAMGSELKPESFLNGVAVGDEANKLYDKIRTSLPSHVKDFRISKKVTIKDDEIYLGDKKLSLPSQFAYCNKQIIDHLQKSVGKSKSHQQRSIKFQPLEQAVLTQKDFIKIIESLTDTVSLLASTDEMDDLLKDQAIWSSSEYAGMGDKIKSVLQGSLWPVRNSSLVKALQDQTGLDEQACDKILVKLTQDKLVKKDTGYELKNATKAKIEQTIKKITLRDNVTAKDIDDLALDKMPSFASHHEEIRAVIKSVLENAPRELTLENFQKDTLILEQPLFKSLFQVLKSYDLIDCGLLETLSITLGDQDTFKKDLVEGNILLLNAKGDFFTVDDLVLPSEAKEVVDSLLSKLSDSGFVKKPSVKFLKPTDSDSAIEDAIDNLKSAVSQFVGEFLKPTGNESSKSGRFNNVGVSTDHVATAVLEEVKLLKSAEEFSTAVCEALEKSIGTLRTIPKVELDNKNLEEYFRGQKLPPIAITFMRSALGGVLNLIEKQEDSGWWGALICALIGVVQIVVGVLISVYCPLIGEMLINEGIGDIVFAVTAGIAGNFSWEAYGDHKIQSLTMSLMMLGVSAALSSATAANTANNAAKSTKNVTKTSANIATMVGKELLKAAIQVAADVAINIAMANVSEEVMDIIFSEFRHNFKKTIKGKINQDKIKQHIKALYSQLGVSDANAVLQRVLMNPKLSQFKDGEVTMKAMKAVQAAASRIEGYKASSSGSSGVKKLISVATVAAEILKYASYGAAIADVFVSTEKYFKALEQELGRKVKQYQKHNSKNNLSDSKLDELADQKVDQFTDRVLTQIQAKVQAIFQQTGTTLLNGAIAPVVESAKGALDESINVLYDNPTLQEGRTELQRLQESRDIRNDETSAPVIESGEIVEIAQIQNGESTTIRTQEGDRSVNDVYKQNEKYEDNILIVKKGEEHYLVERSFSGDFEKDLMGELFPATDAQKATQPLNTGKSDEEEFTKIPILNGIKLEKAKKFTTETQKNKRGQKMRKDKSSGKTVKNYKERIKSTLNTAAKNTMKITLAKKEISGDPNEGAFVLPTKVSFDSGELQYGMDYSLNSGALLDIRTDGKGVDIYGKASYDAKLEYARYTSSDQKILTSLYSAASANIELDLKSQQMEASLNGSVSAKLLEWKFQYKTDEFQVGQYKIKCDPKLALGYGAKFGAGVETRQLKPRGKRPPVRKQFKMTSAKFALLFSAEHNCQVQKVKSEPVMNNFGNN